MSYTVGSSASDKLYEYVEDNNGNVLFDGRSSAEQYFGYDGNDTIDVHRDDGLGDVLHPIDTLDGGAGDDYLFGDHCVMIGGDGNDTIIGASQYEHGRFADTIIGGAGNDLLEGGFGRDVFIFDPGFGMDTISTYRDLNAAGYETPYEFDLVFRGFKSTDLLSISEGVVVYDGQVSRGGIALHFKGGEVLNMYVPGVNSIKRVDFTIKFDDGVFNGNSIFPGVVSDGVDPTRLKFAYLTVAGNNTSQELWGGGGADTIRGAGGDDTIRSMDGHDSVDGSIGNDSVLGGAGNDTIYGGDGNDEIDAGWTYVENGLSKQDIDYDLIFGGAGNDTLRGWGGGDTLDGGSGADYMEGGDGGDLYIIDNMADRAMDYAYEYAVQGVDTVKSYLADIDLADWNMFGSGDRIECGWIASTGSANMKGNSLGNLIYAGLGNNIIDAGTGVNPDTVSYMHATNGRGVVVDLGLSTAQNTVGSGWDALTGFENLAGTGYADKLSGNNWANTLLGDAGNDTISGWGGNDILNGGAGIDSLVGGAGSDVYFVDNQADVVVEVDGNDSGDDSVSSTVSYALSSNLEKLTLTGIVAINGTGNDLNNIISGNVAANVLTGMNGDDRLNGGASADTMVGGAGDDVYYVDNVGDKVIEAHSFDGNDLVLASVSAVLANYVERLTLTGSMAINGIGNSLSNSLIGNSASNVLYGGLGNDSLNGGLGADTLNGGSGNDAYHLDNVVDQIVETSATATEIDSVYVGFSYALGANLENLTLEGVQSINGSGNAAANFITGNEGGNTLSGGLGNDTLSGGGGNDQLFGGAGSDSFIFGSLSGVDKVNDFTSKIDRIVLDSSSLGGVGDRDGVLEGAITRTTSGVFSLSNELVVFSSNIAGNISAASAAAKIGAATANFTIGAERIFVVDNGIQSSLFLFKAGDSDALVESNELILLANINGTTVHTDYWLQA
ncbi:calcium-binding protein [Chitinilyticum piscinae]|uniref:Calcium-binding protein n=1 Tax=Chitinilyticum piscinae TaxID=2866724 RepID=A0A8J7FJY6_9NEIS|nr:calcium-binding protein [Chitinilyticum piscinae]MBE9609287.1 hypothetical protein [Chitinilyticum piscinae]